jgi:hypothetical protein
VLPEEFHKLGVIGGEGLEFTAVLHDAADILPLDDNGRHPARVDRFGEIAERHVLVLFFWLVVDVEEEEDKENDKKPDEYAFIERVDCLILHAKGFNIKSV